MCNRCFGFAVAMSVLEKQIVKLQRRVEELEKLAAEARTLKQELDDRVTAGKVSKTVV